MTGIASHPNPFEGVSPTASALTGSLTLGPRYDAASPLREDISEGQAGLPRHFGLRVLDPDTSNTSDRVFPADVAPFIIETQPMSDGALLVWTTSSSAPEQGGWMAAAFLHVRRFKTKLCIFQWR